MPDDLPKSVDDVSLPIPSEVVGKKIIVFGKKGCPDCDRVKKFLFENAIQYEFYDIEEDERSSSANKKAFKWLTSFATFVPVLVMLDKTIMYSPSNQELHEKI